MRWVFLVLVLLSIPLLIAYAKKGEQQRDHMLVALGGLLFFATGSISLDASIIGWPVWPGTSRGILLSFVDSIALALLVTRRHRSAIPPFLGLSAFLFLIMAAATLIAVVKLAAVFSLFQLAQIIFLFVVLSSELTRESAIRSLLKGLAIGLMIQGGYVIYQKLTGLVQAYGTTQHQNILGMFIQLTAIPLVAAVLEGERSKIIYAGIIASAICIAGGGSRASIGFFALGLVLLIALSVIRRSTPRKWKVVGLGVMAAAAVIPLTLATLQDRFGEQSMRTTEDGRAAFERAARAISADHPFGVGPNNFVSVNNKGGYAAEAGIEWGGNLLDKPVHNAYLLARAEMGWLGEIALILLLGGVATRAYLTGFARRAPPITGLALGSAVGITTMAIHSNYEFAWFTLEVQRLFFVNAAIVAGLMTIAARARADGHGALPDGKEDATRAPVQPSAAGNRAWRPGSLTRPAARAARTAKPQE